MPIGSAPHVRLASDTRWELELQLSKPIAPLSALMHVTPGLGLRVLHVAPAAGGGGAGAGAGARGLDAEERVQVDAEQEAMWTAASLYGVPLVDFGPLVCGGLCAHKYYYS